MPTDPVHQLTALAGHPARRDVAIAWPAVEASIGSRLPADYRSLVEALPDGAFRDLVRVNRPGDQQHPGTEFLGYYAGWLDTWRAWRAAGRGTFPYPIFPEPGGLLPWATGPRMAPVFWLTGPDDPDHWPVILVDPGFQQWGRHPGPASAFLLDALTGRFDTTPFGFTLSSDDRPAFVPAGSAATRPPPPADGPDPAPDPRPAHDFFATRGRATDEFHELATLLGAPPAPRGEPLPDDLPADYRRFQATYGPGRLGDIVVPAPGVLLADVHLRLRLARFPCAVYPEPGGLITWGRTTDGGLLAWAPTVTDPQSWGTVAISSDLADIGHSAELSFTGLLRRYADLSTDLPNILRGRTRPAAPLQFHPAGVVTTQAWVRGGPAPSSG